MQKATGPIIRRLESEDIPQIAKAFEELGWNKPAAQYERYLADQIFETRDVHVAFIENEFAGYLTVCWTSTYPPFRAAQIPEIVDFNVLPKFRRKRIGTALMDRAESEIPRFSETVGIGVGLTADYGAAQRLYILRGYVPDGRGLYHRNHYPIYGEQITVDDDLAIFLTKKLR